jgi:hypothetical protein
LKFLSLEVRKGRQASSEDLFPLGYGERENLSFLSLDGRGLR